jgi:serine/threonine-protein kinase
MSTSRQKRLVAIVGLLAVVATAAAVLVSTLSQISSAPKPGEEPAADTSGPNINGTYRVDYDAKAQTKNGKPVPVDPIPAFAWSFHSACPDTGCVASASRLRDGGTDIQIVLDYVGGRWVEAHMAEAGSCPGGGTAPHLTSWSLAPGPDGTFVGAQTDMYMGTGCATVLQTPVTLTRTGNAMPTAINPSTLPPRIPAAPESLHGRYTFAQTRRGGGESPPPNPVDIRTICARNSLDCGSLFTSREDVGRDNVQVYQFTTDRWTWGVEVDGTCTAGDEVKGTVHQKLIVDLPLPQPNSDPIVNLPGTSTTEFTGDCGENETFDVTLDRVGD